MANPTNFLQWNPTKANQQDDATYASDPDRTGGASGLFGSALANKLFYQATTMVAAIGQFMVNKGYEMQDANLATLVTSLSNILTKADFGTTSGTVCQGNDTRLAAIPAGTSMWFFRNTAPSGWAIDPNATADALLAVKGGTNAYNYTGGYSRGTWTQPGHLHTGPYHTHSTPGHQLTVGEMPNHTHQLYTHFGTGDGGGQTHQLPYTNMDGVIDGPPHIYYDNTYTGGGGYHYHGDTGYSGTGDTSSTVSSDTWRPEADLGIICTKNAY